MTVRDDLQLLSELRNVGLALVDLIEAISPGVEFKKKGRRWVPSENFVTISVQAARARSIAFSLRGHPDEFPDALRQSLPLKKGMGRGAYSECTLKNPSQLPAVAWYIQQAHQLYSKGSSRTRKRVVVREA